MTDYGSLRQTFQAKFKEKGGELATEQLSQLSQQLSSFTVKLEEFARKHREEIKRNPQFRRHFQVEIH